MSSMANFTGCMIGGALGDALGYPVEFMSYDQIIKEHGAEGLKEPLLTDRDVAEISDDTQMMLFTTEGLLWAEENRKKIGYSSVAAKCFCSYQRWLHTQSYPLADPDYGWMIEDARLEFDSPLLKTEELYHKRSPELTCIEALLGAKNQEYGRIEQPINRSKGTAAVVRAAPIGLAFHKNPKRAFEAGCHVAAITHTHPSAYYSAGVFSTIIACLITGRSVEEAVKEALQILERCPAAAEVQRAIEGAITEAKESAKSRQAVGRLGLGTISSEALAIGIYCALSYEEDYKSAVCLAVNQEGDSAASASICGSILGARMTITGLEPEWIKKLECKNLILQMACKLYESYK